MADAVEARRKELHLTPGAFADTAGLTRPGLAPVRNGLRRDYQDVTIIGVAKALHWRADWYDRLLAGEQPVEQDWVDAPDGRSDLERTVDRLQQRVDELEAKLARLEPQPPSS